MVIYLKLKSLVDNNLWESYYYYYYYHEFHGYKGDAQRNSQLFFSMHTFSPPPIDLTWQKLKILYLK